MGRKVVYLDRDGVICEYVPHLHRREDLKLMPRVGEAISLLKKNGYHLVLITNQSVVARGMCSLDELQKIHEYMQELLQKECGQILDKIYFCPHHPDFDIDCECRKPKPGMINQAKVELGADEGFMIGDKPSDIEAGNLAGCKTIFVGDGNLLLRDIEKPDYYARDLYHAMEIILDYCK